MFARRTMLSVLILLIVVTISQAQKKPSLEDLSWLSGCWEGRQGDAVLEEIWSKPGGGSMLGLGRTVKANRTVSSEFMQFREENGNLVFLPQPQGGERVSFALKDSFGGRLTFENKEHDFPQRVIYEQKGKELLATIEGTYKGKQEREDYLMRRVRCN